MSFEIGCWSVAFLSFLTSEKALPLVFFLFQALRALGRAVACVTEFRVV